jgi:hypothetical protein
LVSSSSLEILCEEAYFGGITAGSSASRSISRGVGGHVDRCERGKVVDSDGNEPARDEPKGSLEPDRQFYWLGSRARAGLGRLEPKLEPVGENHVLRRKHAGRRQFMVM